VAALLRPKQGFDFDRDLHSELEKQVLDYGTSFPYLSIKSGLQTLGIERLVRVGFLFSTLV
jgi:hypothetical protein